MSPCLATKPDRGHSDIAESRHGKTFHLPCEAVLVQRVLGEPTKRSCWTGNLPNNHSYFQVYALVLSDAIFTYNVLFTYYLPNIIITYYYFIYVVSTCCAILYLSPCKLVVKTPCDCTSANRNVCMYVCTCVCMCIIMYVHTYIHAVSRP